MQVLTITMIRSLLNNRILCRHLKVTTFYYRHCHDGFKSETEKSHLEKIIDDWTRFISLEINAEIMARLEQEKQFIGVGKQYVTLPATKLIKSQAKGKNPAEGGITLELSLDQFDTDKKNQFLDVYRTRTRISLWPANDASGVKTGYKAVIRGNKNNNNVLRLQLIDGQYLNLHEIEAVNEWAIQILPELNKFYEDLKKFYETDAYQDCIGFPQMLKCFGQTELDRVNEENREMAILSEELNDSQKAAIHSALNEQQNFVAIHGPPGTGKTRVIAEIAYQNALLACLECGVSADKCTRLGFLDSDNEKIYSTHFDVMFKKHVCHKDLLVFYEERTQLWDKFKSSEVKSQKGDIKKLNAIDEKIRKLENFIRISIIRNVRIIFCTAFCTELFKSFLWYFKPNLIIMDEGAQILEPTTWHMLLHARRFVLVGDHKQLKPIILIGKNAGKSKSDQPTDIIDEKKFAENMSITLLQRLATDVLTGKEAYLHMLNVNYRSNELINRWSNEHFYDGKLSTHDSVKDITLKDIVKRPKSKILGNAKTKTVSTQKCDQFFIQEPLVLVDTALFSDADRRECLQRYPYPPNLLDFHERKSGSVSLDNTGEALCAVHHLLALQHIGGLQPQHIGCITPYNGQTRLIKNFLGAHNFEVSSVDAFQGQQREAIVMSFVRSNYSDYIGFMEKLNRMNVAITRAQRQFLLIASSRSLRSNKTLNELYKLIHREGRIVHPKELLLKSPFKIEIDNTIQNEGGRAQNRNKRKG